MAGILTSVYSKLPAALQNAGISAYGYYWKRRRFGGAFEKHYHEFKERESFTALQWRDYTTQQVRSIVAHAFETVPYYHQSFKNSGFNIDTLKTFEIEMLPRLPFLEKDALRKYGTTNLLSTVRQPGRQFYASSGSTGTPTSILYSHDMHQRLNAAYESRVRNWAGVDRSMPRAMIGGRRVVPEGVGKAPYYRYNYFEKQVYLSAYHISPSTVANYVKGITTHHSEYMVGYAMSNFFLARFIEEAGLKVPAMKAVLTSSEKLTPEMRETFRTVYRCKAFDAWSGVENCALISENEFDQLLISPDVGFVEVLDPHGNPVAPGEVGEVVCTGFLNYDQPLIRYRIGDMVRLAKDQTTRCGRSLPVVDEIIGRMEDVVVGRDGREMVRFHGIFADLATVIEGQIVQLDYEDFVINVVPATRLSEADRSTISKRMETQLGTVRLQFNELSEISRGPNGKFKAVISRVNRKTQ